MNHSLEYFLKQVPDHRRAQGLMHQKVPLLMMIVLSNMAGCYGYREMASYMKDNYKSFKELYELKHGVIKHVALRTFIQKLDFKALLKAFREWSNQFIELEEGDIVSIDGKGLKSTVENSHDASQNYKSMVSLFCEKTGLIKDTEMIELKKNHEIGAAQSLIGRLEAKGIIITTDALHCQKKL